MSGLDRFGRCETWFGNILPSLQKHGADSVGFHSATKKKICLSTSSDVKWKSSEISPVVEFRDMDNRRELKVLTNTTVKICPGEGTANPSREKRFAFKPFRCREGSSHFRNLARRLYAMTPLSRYNSHQSMSKNPDRTIGNGTLPFNFSSG